MSGLSNPTSRVLDVLNFLAAHPTESFTLAEIARNVGLTKASGHRILTTMAEAQFLSRHPKHKTYSLGVAPVAIGEAALEKHRGIGVARKEVARLAEEFSLQCSISTIADGDFLLLATEGMPQTHDGHRRVGERVPALPPIGIGMLAWAPEAERAAYGAAAAADLGGERLAFLDAAMATIRARGFGAVAIGPAMARLRDMMRLPLGKVRDEAYWRELHALIGEFSRDEVQIVDLAAPGSWPVAYVSAPVFAPSGEVAMELVLSGFPAPLGGEQVAAFAERVRTAAAVVTAEIRGRPPRG